MAEIRLLKEFPEYASKLAFWAFREWYGNRAIDFDIVIKAYQNRISNDQPPVSWIAIEKYLPVGMVSLKEDDLWSRKDLSPWLASLYVLPEYRKQGIGEQLIKAVIEGAKQFDYKALYLFTDENRKNLYDYYKKLNWNYLDKAEGNDENIVNIFYYSLT